MHWLQVSCDRSEHFPTHLLHDLRTCSKTCSPGTKMRRIATLPNFATAMATVFFAGCGIEPETLDSLRGMVQAASVAATAPPPHDAREPDETRFDPPHPDRVDPFTFPEGQSLAVASPSQPLTTSIDVDVLGFAQVDEPRVFLNSNGSTRSMAVGDVIDGIQVIGIHPPAVDLQRGGLRWRATLFSDQDSP